jgi:hypothetical protein
LTPEGNPNIVLVLLLLLPSAASIRNGRFIAVGHAIQLVNTARDIFLLGMNNDSSETKRE